METKKNRQCLYCGAKDLVFFIKRKDGINLVKCEKCGLIFTEILPFHEITSVYSKGYFDKNNIEEIPEMGYIAYSSSNYLNFLWQKDIFYLFYGSHFDSKIRLLDVGCAHGYFLQLLSYDNRIEAKGIDIANEAVRKAREKGLNAEVKDIFEETTRYDVITAWDLIEHIPDIGEFFSKVFDLLKENGIFVFSTPDVGARIVKEKGEEWVGFRSSLEHVLYFDKYSLSTIINDIFNNIPIFFTKIEGEFATLIGFVRKGKYSRRDIIIKNLLNSNFSDKEGLNYEDKIHVLSFLYHTERKENYMDEMANLIKNIKEPSINSHLIPNLITTLDYWSYTYKHKKEEHIMAIENKLKQYQVEFEHYKQVAEEKIDRLSSEVEKYKHEIEHDKQVKQAEIDALYSQLNAIYESDFWKVASFYYKLRDKIALKHIHKTVSILRREGIKGLTEKIKAKFSGIKNTSESAIPLEFNPYKLLKLLKPIDVIVINKDYFDINIKNNNLKFSVIIPVKNEGNSIARLLNDLKEQSLKPEEIIFVDGGSEDKTVEIIKNFNHENDLNIKLIEAGIGNIAKHRNIGIREAKNELIVLIDAGNILTKSLCQNLVGALADYPDADLVGGVYHPTKKSSWAYKFIWDWDSIDYTTYLPSARAMLIRKSKALSIGEFPEYLTYAGEDTLFGINYRKVCKKWVINKAAIVYWEAPENKEQALQKAFIYGKGDGESGIGNFRFYEEMINYTKTKKISFNDEVLHAYFLGYIEGRRNRLFILKEKRKINKNYLILSENAFTDNNWIRKIALELIRRNNKVTFCNLHFSNNKEVFIDTDYSLLDLYYFKDFSIKDYIQNHNNILSKTVVIFDPSHLEFVSIANRLKELEPKLKVIYAHEAAEEIFKEELKDIIKTEDFKQVIIYPPTVDWNIPLLQRYQHMAIHLANLGYLFFFCTLNQYDNIYGFKKIKDRLFITNMYDLVTKNIDKFIIYLHAANRSLKNEDIKKIKERTSVIILEYADELHPDIIGNIPDFLIKRNDYLMQKADIVMVTSERLLNLLNNKRKDICMVPNAVDYNHFHKDKDYNNIPKDLREIVYQGKPIIGYFGALAKWFDYNLVTYLAKSKDINIVLIGWDYDGSLKEASILNYKNIHYLGVKHYNVLPYYAVWFDVAIIPFVVNEVTQSTSPLKLFEYMALGKPIVTTNIKECQKYKSVLIAKDENEFLGLIDQALQLKNDRNYLKLLDKEAMENTWEARAKQIDKILQEKMRERGWI